MKTLRILTLICALAFLHGFTSSVLAAPTNDYCANAAFLFGSSTNVSFETNSATFDGPGHYMEGPNIWYLYAATSTGNVTMSLCGSLYDTQLAVYDGAVCNPSVDNTLAYNDDYSGCGLDSQVVFPVVAGNLYLVEIGGYEQDTGTGVINITAPAEACPPANDKCSNATAIGNATNLPFSTQCATSDGSGSCITGPNIWFRYTASCTKNIVVSLCGSNYDTKVAVYNTTACNPSNSNLLVCDDDSCGQQSKAVFSAVAGQQYLIEVGGHGISKGQGVLNIYCEPDQPSILPNDNCASATAIGNVTNLHFDTTLATHDGTGCCISGANIWYLYTAPCTDEVTVSLCGSLYDTKVAVYSGSQCFPGLSRLVAYNDDNHAPDCYYQSVAKFDAIAGMKYLIEIGGWSSETGEGFLTVSCGGGVTPPEDKPDLGDAPDSSNNYGYLMSAYPSGGPSGVRAYYPTVFNDGSLIGPRGPMHINDKVKAYLGQAISKETEADTGSDEDGVNNIIPPTNTPDLDNFDDGVVFPINMPHCEWSTIDYMVTVTEPNTALWVNVWCDWNRDGDWDDDSSNNTALTSSKGFISEWAVQNQYIFNLPVGVNAITSPAFLPWHPNTTTQPLWMRITLSEQPWRGGENPGVKGNSGSGPSTGYEIGETEDYYFTPEAICSVCQDLNGDGFVDVNDLLVYINDWIANCN